MMLDVGPFTKGLEVILHHVSYMIFSLDVNYIVIPHEKWILP